MVIGNNEDGEDGATKDWLLMMRAAIMMMAMRIIVRAMMMLKRLAFSRDHSSHFRDKFTTEGVYNEDDDGEYESIATVGESRVWRRADFQSGSRVSKKVF